MTTVDTHRLAQACMELPLPTLAEVAASLDLATRDQLWGELALLSGSTFSRVATPAAGGGGGGAPTTTSRAST